jgi:hypothetical protein
MKVIFLDNDGVICLSNNWGERAKKWANFKRDNPDSDATFDNKPIQCRFDDFDKGAVMVLNEILEKTGAEIILRALEAPLRQIADNAGIDGSVVADEVSQKPLSTGYDANKGQYVDMLKAGIIDPVKVVRTALTNAASIAGLLLTTEALVTTYDKDDKKKRKVEGSIN